MKAAARGGYSFDTCIFEPSIQHLIAHARPQPGEQVLDVACGSGIACRRTADLVGPGGCLTGMDIGPRILKKAAGIYGGPSPARWVRADFHTMPFASSSFDVTLCHQGLQFADNPAVVVRELRRVTGGDGRLVIMTWTDIADCPFYFALEAALRTHLGERAGEFAARPFSLPDADRLTRLLGADFDSVDIVRRTIETEHPSAAAFATAFMTYIPGASLPAGDRTRREKLVVRDMIEQLAPWETDGKLRAPIVAHLAVCR